MRSKSIIIVFDKSGMPDDQLNELGLDWGLDGSDGVYKCYIHADGKYAVPETLPDLLPHAISAENTWQGSDYLDAYVQMSEKPSVGLYIEYGGLFYKNVRFSELKSGFVNIDDIIYKKKIYDNGTN